MRKLYVLLIGILLAGNVSGARILIPMDKSQKDHLKAYGIAYWVVDNGINIKWLLNYRGGSFLIPYSQEVETECTIRGVSKKIIPDAKANGILETISSPAKNMSAVKLVKAPDIAVYSPKDKMPWDDAVTLALTYAEIPYDVVYDSEVINGKLANYDWLHLHHEDFTGQFGKFWGNYRHMDWYQENVREQRKRARKFGFNKVSQLKLFVANTIRDYVANGGFLFAMCSATDTYDIALAAENVDICKKMFDGDPMDANAQQKLDFSNTFAFKDFKIISNPYKYEYSNIDVSLTRNVKKNEDYFTLFDFSAKWDPVPTILCQNHTNIIKGFMGQTTAYNKDVLKSNVVILGENESANEARYIHGEHGEGTWTFYGGHDPEDYRHYVGDPRTKLELHPNSPGYRLILNNILFPAAKKKKLKTQLNKLQKFYSNN